MSPPEQAEHNKKIAARWEKVSDFFFVAAHAMTPSTQIPLVNLIMNPIVNGFWGCWYATWAIALHYDPALKDEYEKQLPYDKAQSAFNRASYLAGSIATISGFLMLIPPLWPAIPILLTIAAIATTVSNVLWVAGIGIDLYKEVKNGPHDSGRPWRIAQKASTLLYSLGSIVIAALVVAALFTPVGWAVGAGALTFAIAASAATLAVFGISKFCQWKAHKNAQANKESQSSLLSEKSNTEVQSQPSEIPSPLFTKGLVPLNKQPNKAKQYQGDEMIDKEKGKEKNNPGIATTKKRW